MAALGEAARREGDRGRAAWSQLAREIAADLVVIGPEVAVEAGLADALEAAGIPCFGPTAAAGRLEILQGLHQGLLRPPRPADRRPTGSATTPRRPRRRWTHFEPPYVVKADGLAAGKGVVIAPDRAAAEAAIDDALRRRASARPARGW